MRYFDFIISKEKSLSPTKLLHNQANNICVQLNYSNILTFRFSNITIKSIGGRKDTICALKLHQRSSYLFAKNWE